MVDESNYRSRFLLAVQEFSRRTPTSTRKAHKIIELCAYSLRPHTFDFLKWSGIVSRLQDSLFYGDYEFLRRLEAALSDDSQRVERTYLSYNYSQNFTIAEREWYSRAAVLTDFLSQFPFPNDGDPISNYDRLSHELDELGQRVSRPSNIGDTTIYAWLLHEVAAISTGIDLARSLSTYGYLVPQLPYASISERTDPPDMAIDLQWARRALETMMGNNWISIVWYMSSEEILLVR